MTQFTRFPPSASSGGVGTDVHIFDSAGNPITSTGGALNTNTKPVAWKNFGQSTPLTVIVTDESTQLLDQNSLRVFAKFTNNGANTVYLEYSLDAVYLVSQPLFPNASYTIPIDELYTGVVNAITNTGLTAAVRVTEGVI